MMVKRFGYAAIEPIASPHLTKFYLLTCKMPCTNWVDLRPFAALRSEGDCGGLLAAASAAAALGLGLEGSEEPARSQARAAPDEAAPSATSIPRPIPEAGPLAQPKSLDQVSLPAKLTRQATQPAPEKIALGQKLSFDGLLWAEGTVACSTCHDPARAFTDGRPTSIGLDRPQCPGSASATRRPF
jgi:Di-haem cytochrome c peroxidase